MKLERGQAASCQKRHLLAVNPMIVKREIQKSSPRPAIEEISKDSQQEHQVW
jgi:hypothetical protein